MSKNLVIIAHDRMKPKMVEFLKEREDWLWGRTLIATGRTAEFAEKESFKVPIRHLSPGRSGGYIEITDMIEKGEVGLVLFFRDHLVKTAYHEDIQRLLETCNVQNIPLATNEASAELLIIGLIRKELSDKGKAS